MELEVHNKLTDFSNNQGREDRTNTSNKKTTKAELS